MELFKLYVLICASWAAIVVLMAYTHSKIIYGFPASFAQVLVMVVSWISVTILAPISVIMLPISIYKGTYKESLLVLALSLYKLEIQRGRKVDLDNLLLTATYAVNADLMSTETYDAIKAKWDKEQQNNA